MSSEAPPTTPPPPLARPRRKVAEARKAKHGQAPGVAVYAGAPRPEGIHLTCLDYDAERVRELQHPSPDEIRRLVADPTVSWFDLSGIHDPALVQQVCEALGIHPLAMEDVLNPHTRPKIDDYGDHLLVVLKCATRNGQPGHFELEQVSLVLGPRWVASFQERPGDGWHRVRDRVHQGRGRIRHQGPAYLLHALMDAVVDDYFDVLDSMEGEIESIEALAVDGVGVDVPRRAHAIRGRLYALRRLIWPVREGLAPLLRGESARIDKGVVPYYRDLADHLSQSLDLMDGSRDRLLALVELHLALASHAMNQVMKVLTVMTTIFMPLTFIAGVYGMNFQHMPELGWPWAYPAVLALMLVLAVGMAWWFQRKRWL